MGHKHYFFGGRQKHRLLEARTDYATPEHTEPGHRDNIAVAQQVADMSYSSVHFFTRKTVFTGAFVCKVSTFFAF